MTKKLTEAQRRALNWLAIQRDDPTPKNLTSAQPGWFIAWANAPEYHQYVIPASEPTLRVLVEQGYLEVKRFSEWGDKHYRLVKDWAVDPAFKEGFLAYRQKEADRYSDHKQVDSEYRSLFQRPSDLAFEVGTFVYIYVDRTQYLTEQLGLVVALDSQDERGRNRYAVQTSQGVFTYPAHQMVAVDGMTAVVWRESDKGELTDIRQELLTTTLFLDDSPVAWYDDQDGHLVVCDSKAPDLGFAYRPYFVLWLLVSTAFAVSVKEIRK